MDYCFICLYYNVDMFAYAIFIFNLVVKDLNGPKVMGSPYTFATHTRS